MFNLFGNRFNQGEIWKHLFFNFWRKQTNRDSCGLQDNEHTYCRVFNYRNLPMEVKKKNYNVSLFILYNRCFKTYVFKENKVQFRKKMSAWNVCDLPKYCIFSEWWSGNHVFKQIKCKVCLTVWLTQQKWLIQGSLLLSTGPKKYWGK